MANKAFYTAWAEVAPDFSKFGREVDKGFKDALEPAGRKGGVDAGKGVKGGLLGAVSKLAGPLAVAFGALKLGQLITDTIVDGINQASDLEEAATAIGEVFGGQATAIQDFAKKGAKAFGETEIAVLRSAQSFGIYGKAAGLSGDELTSFSTDMVALGTDLASFFNTDTQTAIDAIGAGLRGEAEPLRQFGVLLDDATLKARAMTLGIYDGKGALTQQQKILASQAEILAQTSTAQGDFARTSGGLANQQRILAASWSDIVTQIGGFFLPVVTQLVTFLNSNVIPAIQGFFGSLSSGDMSGVTGMFGDFMPILESIGQAFAPILAAVMQLAPILLELWTNLSPIGIIFKAIQPILPVLAALLQQIADIVGSTLNRVFEVLLPFVEKLADLISAILVPILPILADIFAAVLVPAIELVATVLNALMPIIEGLLTILGGLIDFIVGVFTGDWDLAWSGIQQIFQGVIDTIVGIWNGLLDIFGGIGDFIADIFSGVGEWLVDAGRALIQGFVDGITGAVGMVGDAIGGVMDWVGSFFPHSPAKRGPFSGSGWTDLKNSGSAIYDQFVGGMTGPDPQMPSIGASVRVPRPAPLDDISRTGVGGSGRPVEMNVYPQQGMSEETIGSVAASRLAFEMRRDS